MEDDLLSLDELQTLSEHPQERLSFTPGPKEMKFVGTDGSVKRIENNYFYMKTSFKDQNITAQKSSDDCWAACSMMLFKHHGVEFLKKDMELLQAKFSAAEKPSDEASVFLNFTKSHNKTATYCRPVKGEMLFYSLGNNCPILVGFTEDSGKGHIRLVVACYFSFIKPTGKDIFLDRDINMAVDVVEMIDPDGGRKVTMTGDEFKKKADFAISYSKVSGRGIILIK